MSGRRLQVVHRTGYRYSSPVRASFNELRMTPADDHGQRLLAYDLRVFPYASVTRYTDYWGATVAAFEVNEPHGVLEVVATARVDTQAAVPVTSTVGWADLSDPRVVDRWAEFLEPTGYVDDAAADPDRADLVVSLGRLGSPREAALDAVEVVNQRLRYTPGVTTVSTTAHEAWASGHGVCQDFTHATLSLVRSLGIPARYVSGYLHSEEEAVGEVVVGESHAWVEMWLGDWQAFDPTNSRSVGSAHVVVARGRDYADVPPFKGIYSGGRSEGPEVSVEITALVA
jgi:transglutaminase-like putative cysteine protease